MSTCAPGPRSDSGSPLSGRQRPEPAVGRSEDSARRGLAPSLMPQKRRPAMVQRKTQQRTKIRTAVGKGSWWRALAQPHLFAKQRAVAHLSATVRASHQKGWPCESDMSDRDRKAKASGEGQGDSDGHHVCLSEQSES